MATFRASLSIVLMCLACGFALATGSVASAQPTLRVATVPLPPMVIVDPQTHHVSGQAADSVRALANKCGADVSFIVPPSWNRAYTMAVKGTADGLMPANHSRERAKVFDFHPKPLIDLGPALLVRADSPVKKFKGLHQLDGKRVAIQQNILLEPAFDAYVRSDKVTLVVRGNATALVEELLSGRVDYIADAKTVLEYHLGENGILNRVRAIAPALGTSPQYLALSKKRSATFTEGTPLSKCLLGG